MSLALSLSLSFSRRAKFNLQARMFRLAREMQRHDFRTGRPFAAASPLLMPATASEAIRSRAPHPRSPYEFGFLGKTCLMRNPRPELLIFRSLYFCTLRCLPCSMGRGNFIVARDFYFYFSSVGALKAGRKRQRTLAIFTRRTTNFELPSQESSKAAAFFAREFSKLFLRSAMPVARSFVKSLLLLFWSPHTVVIIRYPLTYCCVNTD